MPARPAIYLDANASAPLSQQARAALHQLLESGLLANPSSVHSHGRQAKRLTADAREAVAFSLGRETDPEQILFTSSGTEANQLAIRSVFEPLLKKGEKPHWITSKVEHDSVLQMVPWLLERGGTVSYLPVDQTGAPVASELSGLWTPATALVSLVWVNNETGVISDVAALAREVRAQDGLLHLDAAQAWGKLPIDVASLGAHLVSVSGHKIGGLAGSGALWIRRGVTVSALMPGKQEKGRRGGTENLVGIAAIGSAASKLDPLGWAKRVAPLRDRLEHAICDRIQGTLVNGRGAARVANTLSLSFEGVEGDGLVMALDLAGYSVSAGSACSSGVIEPSHVLMALGRTKAQAMAGVRISFADLSPGSVEELEQESFVENFVNALSSVVSRFRTRM